MKSRWQALSGFASGQQLRSSKQYGVAVFLACLFLPASAWACVFLPPYRLPVPFSMYAWGSSAALGLSFAVMALFARAPSSKWTSGASLAIGPVAEAGSIIVEPATKWTQLVSVTLLLLCIATGLFGTQDPMANFNMTFFWVVFVLAVPYATLIFGDFYAVVNPWKAIVSWCDAHGIGGFAGVVKYPQGLGYYPALVLYMAFISLELFGHHTPFELSLALIIYSLVTTIGAWLFGARAWFRYGELFGVLLRLIGYVAPIEYSKGSKGSPFAERHWRLPFSGLLEEKAEHVSLLLFILFMLSSTAYDGLHETLPWMGLFWRWFYPRLAPLLSADPRSAYAQALLAYNLWQWCWLIASPFVYLAIFRAFLAVTKVICKAQCSVRDLSLRFALTLIPIVIVYHVTHYYPTLFSQGTQIVRLISDPFGFGWNLLGTANLPITPIMFGVSFIWESQVILIVAGHIISCYLAHAEALRVFPSPRKATLSQIPILLLMVLFTTVGLKILSMPLGPAN